MKPKTVPDKPSRLPDGKFKRGESGNPSGRPKTENSILRQQLSEKGSEVIAKVLDAALTGDMQACKMVLDRISPPLKPQSALIKIDGPMPESISKTAHMFIEAAANGKIPSDIAAQLVASVGTLTRIIEVDEIMLRIDKLEAISDES